MNALSRILSFLLRRRVVVYPLRCAMHGAINIWTERWGWVCLKPPTRVFKTWWPGYFYLSPNATPWAATLMLGAGDSFLGREERHAIRWRRETWGHGYDLDEHDPQADDVPPRLARPQGAP